MSQQTPVVHVSKRHWIRTPSEMSLVRALRKRGVTVRSGVRDGHKTIDLSLPDARLDIEVDGIHHFTQAEQIISDLDRGFYSHRDGFDTMHIPNELIATHLEEIADALAIVAKKRPKRLLVRVVKLQSTHLARERSQVR